MRELTQAECKQVSGGGFQASADGLRLDPITVTAKGGGGGGSSFGFLSPGLFGSGGLSNDSSNFNEFGELNFDELIVPIDVEIVEDPLADGVLTLEELEAFFDSNQIEEIAGSFANLDPDEQQAILTGFKALEGQFIKLANAAQLLGETTRAADLLRFADGVGLIGNLLSAPSAIGPFLADPGNVEEAGDAFAFVAGVAASAGIGAAIGGPVGAAVGFGVGLIVESFGDEAFEALVPVANSVGVAATDFVFDVLENPPTFTLPTITPQTFDPSFSEEPFTEEGVPNPGFLQGIFGGDGDTNDLNDLTIDKSGTNFQK